MLIYWLTFAILALGAWSYASANARPGTMPVSAGEAAVRSSRSVVLAAAGIALIILIGLRYRVGGDWSAYLEIFRYSSTHDLFYAIDYSRQEPGFIFLNWLAGQLGVGMWFVDVVCAGIFTYGLMQICRQQPNPWLALVVATPFLIIVVAMGYTGAALPFIHSSAIIDRLAIYLIPMQIFVYARIGYAFGLIQRGWLMWTTLVIAYSAFVQFVWINYAVNAFAWLPYRSYLSAPTDTRRGEI